MQQFLHWLANEPCPSGYIKATEHYGNISAKFEKQDKTISVNVNGLQLVANEHGGSLV